MKRTITFLSLTCIFFTSTAQIALADFETFTLSPNSTYNPTTSTPFQTGNAKFLYKYNSSWSSWINGFSYTNIHDSISTGYTHPYGVRAYKGYNNSDTYIVGYDTTKIILTTAQSTVNGFYVTNTTYAYKSMASGDGFARKFGDTTGTGSGTTIAQGSYPDFFKLVIKGYKNGVVKNDSVSVFLANFTFTNNTQDFILNTWQYVNTSAMGAVDSLQFFIRSSDVGLYGINTPLYFALDNFETTGPNMVGIKENRISNSFEIYPNPFNSSIIIQTKVIGTELRVKDVSGKLLYSETLINENSLIELSSLQSGIYFLEITEGDQKTIKKLIKN